MQFLLKQRADLSKLRTKCLVVPVYASKSLPAALQSLDTLTQGQISQLFKNRDVTGKLAEVNWLYLPGDQAIEKLLLVGCGSVKSFADKELNTVINAVGKALVSKSLAQATILAPADYLNAKNAYSYARQLAEQLIAAIYRFDQFKTKPEPAIALNKITLLFTNKALQANLQLGLTHGQAIANGVATTKNVANMPPNICNAAYLAKQGQALAEQYSSITTQIVNEAQMQQLGMHAYLAVGRGSENESMLTVMQYQGASDPQAKPIVLVGKGLTFDSGGISIKPSANMDEMKYDMCGAATVLGVIQAVAELKLPLNVIGVMAGCENMPDGKSYRPGDILTTMSGQTVEVINTDAEGRLVLCDTLTYVERFKPLYVIDIATLTGACIIALGYHYSSVIANNDMLADKLLKASQQAQDKAWRLPMDEAFQKQVDSSIADLVNAAGRDGGTITAGCFLSRFAQNYPWAHLDIAGTAWQTGGNKSATGRPVSLLVQFLLNQVTA